MLKLQNELKSKTKPKRNQSFHEDRPRAAALKCKKKVFRRSSNSFIKSQNGNGHTKQKLDVQKKKIVEHTPKNTKSVSKGQKK